MCKLVCCKCVYCCEWFYFVWEGQVVCSFECVSVIGKKQIVKVWEVVKVRVVKCQCEFEKEGCQCCKVRLVEFRFNGYYKVQVQKVFNVYICVCDVVLLCISCGEINLFDLYGGQWDCGYFKMVGVYFELCFEECNVYKQCKLCNVGVGKYIVKELMVVQ